MIAENARDNVHENQHDGTVGDRITRRQLQRADIVLLKRRKVKACHRHDYHQIGDEVVAALEDPEGHQNLKPG